MRFDTFSTQIFKYYVPEMTKNAPTLSVEISFEPEHDYSPMEVLFSLDDKINRIEDKPVAHENDEGLTLKFANKDFSWCVKCFIYLVVNVEFEDRYYITSLARQQNDPLTNIIPLRFFANPFQMECYEYFVWR